MKLSHALAVACAAAATVAGAAVRRRPLDMIYASQAKRELLQDIVTWDEHSLFVNGERIFIFSGEFHPFRLPVPSLWIDVFQKIKALGFNCVSFYTDWALLEGKPGEFAAEGVFALDTFFDAAMEAGIYLIARPGPYINAEVSGGGFPGWIQRVMGTLRTNATDYLSATDNYVANIGSIIAKAQITNGGPVILYQPENEYTSSTHVVFPNPEYMQYVEDQARNASIVVPFISNDAGPDGHNAPGTGMGEVDIYGHDGYPLGFNCASPTSWPSNALPTYYRSDHLKESPSTPYSIDEFQGGSFDPWGGVGFTKCAQLLNEQFERVFYKNNYAAGVAILNLYMIYGGTNWGNLGHPGGYTSYDYGAVIAEDLTITREKYAELKLQGQFLKVSPAFVNATAPTSVSTSLTNDTSLSVTPVIGNGTATKFYIIRHSTYQSTSVTPYTLNVSTSLGNLTLPHLGGSLTLSGRDSKVHLTDYAVANYTLLYSTAEVYTWKKFADKTVLLLYGGPGEHHEVSILTTANATTVEGSGVTVGKVDNALVLSWDVSSTRRIVEVDGLLVYLLDRNSAYNYWVPDLPAGGAYSAFGTSHFSPASIIVNAGLLVRTAYVSGSTLMLTADFNTSTLIEIIGAPSGTDQLKINNNNWRFSVDDLGVWHTNFNETIPHIVLPNLQTSAWKYINGLPEINSNYNDSAWTVAILQSNNTIQQQVTPDSLYGSDYGYHTGYLIFRGHFTAVGNESSIWIYTQGGSAYGHSVWLGNTYLGSWAGNDKTSAYNGTYALSNLTAGHEYVLTVVVDNMGLDEDWTVGTDYTKHPRGILNYGLNSHAAVSWKLTGNLGGEDYADHARGPLNEGGSYAERNGYHLPSPPSSSWASSSPYNGLSTAGIGFYTTSFSLNMPKGWTVPISFVFTNATTSPTPDYRVMLFVNGWQFGKYVNNVGPQTSFFVPEGILNYHGTNDVAISLWALQNNLTALGGLDLQAGAPVWTGRPTVRLVDSPAYSERPGAY